MEKEEPLPAEVQKLLERKLELVKQIRELKARSSQVSLELAKTGSTDFAVRAAMMAW